MSESKKFPNRKFYNHERTKKSQKITGKCYS